MVWGPVTLTVITLNSLLPFQLLTMFAGGTLNPDGKLVHCAGGEANVQGSTMAAKPFDFLYARISSMRSCASCKAWETSPDGAVAFMDEVNVVIRPVDSSATITINAISSTRVTPACFR